MILAAETVGAILGDAGMTILIGLVVVFAVLLLLTGIFKLFGLLMSGVRKDGEASPAASAPAAAVPAAAPMLGNTERVSSAPTVQNGIPDETVAVISATMAAIAPAGTQYAVSSIRKLDQ